MKKIGSDIYFNHREFEQNRYHKLGEGTDAQVFDARNGFVYKLYNIRNLNLDVETKTYQKGSTLKEHIYRKRYSKKIIDLAIERQVNIPNTKLPCGSIFIFNPELGIYQFRGCIYEKYKHIYDIFIGFGLPKSVIIKRILLPTLNELKTLCEHYIYSQDIYSKKSTITTHSNVKLDLKLTPKLIDLDGKSAFYDTKANKGMEMVTNSSFLFLMLDLLYDIDTFESEFNADDIALCLQSCNITSEFIDTLAYEDPDYETLLSFLYYSLEGFKNKKLTRSKL